MQILNIHPLFKLSQLPLPCSPFPPAPSCHSYGTQSLPCIQSASHRHSFILPTTSLTNRWFSVTIHSKSKVAHSFTIRAGSLIPISPRDCLFSQFPRMSLSSHSSPIFWTTHALPLHESAWDMLSVCWQAVTGHLIFSVKVIELAEKWVPRTWQFCFCANLYFCSLTNFFPPST